MKFLNLGAKTPSLGAYCQKVEKTFVIFQINTLQLIKIQKIVQNKNILNFGTKNALIGYFWTVI